LPHSAETDSNPLNDAPESVKKQLLSLQVLFPNEFLPALDLLDRRLITRFLIGNVELPPTAGLDVQQNPSTTTHTNPPTTTTTHISNHQIDSVHYVRSAQQRTSRYSTAYETSTSYEVRLQAWNCTCPAFAFAAFPFSHSPAPVPTYSRPSPAAGRLEVSEVQDEEKEKWVFGGVSLGAEMPPVCKHLLACVLAEKCKGVFGECVEERKVGVELAAGWAAGWGG
jgi:hypothetical protein